MSDNQMAHYVAIDDDTKTRIRRALMSCDWKRYTEHNPHFAATKYPGGFEDYARSEWMKYDDEAEAVLQALDQPG